MSQPFVEAMQHISKTMKKVYKAEKMALIPGSGTYAMEACARQFGTGKKIVIIRNGYFSYRWSHILETTKITDPDKVTVIKAAASDDSEALPAFAPVDPEEVAKRIRSIRPDVVFAPHVETSTGMILPDSYITTVAKAAHDVGAVFVLDCVASGTVWVDMKQTGVDAIISAPQKGWTGPACCGLVMLSKRAYDLVTSKDNQPETNSFCCNLQQWTGVMDSYVDGKAKYYTTLPTDALMMWVDVLKETEEFGLDKSKEKIAELGAKIRKVLVDNGFPSVAAAGYEAPGVVVSYSTIPNMYAKFKEQGLQVAGGVPFQLGEKVDARKQCFRIGLFGLDKNRNVDHTVATFRKALEKIVLES